MRTAKPNELQENAIPLFTAELSLRELKELLPIRFQDIDNPDQVPEPSQGALVRLNSGRYVVLFYGKDSKLLTVLYPGSSDPNACLRDFLAEVPLLRSRISWSRPGTAVERVHLADMIREGSGEVE